jgi:hypothetical protein
VKSKRRAYCFQPDSLIAMEGYNGPEVEKCTGIQ